MKCQLAFSVLISLGSVAMGGITLGTNTNQTSASNVVLVSGASSPTFYYSSVSASQDSTNTYWIGTDGVGNCNTNINPTCINNASNPGFWLQAADSVAPSGNAQFYLILAPTTVPTAPATGGTAVPIQGGGNVVLAQWPYTQTNSTPVPWGGPAGTTLCNSIVSAITGTTIDAQCGQTPVGTNFEPVSVTLYIIGDANGNGQIDPGESVLAVPMVFQSTIPINESIATQVGLYQFQTFPGDGECVLLNMAGDLDLTPTGENGGTGAQYLRFYYVTTGDDVYNSYNPTDFQAITPATTPGILYDQLTVGTPDTTGGVTLTPNNFLTGLSNGANYYFRASIVDNAGNIGYVTQTSDDNPSTPALQGAPLVVAAHACQPGPIAGLISKNGNCFIATVAYGSQMADEVRIFREFRDRVLMKTRMGQKFIRWYYHYGAEYAEKIRNHDNMRAFVRGGLYPLLGFSWLALKIGAYNACLLISTLLLLPFLIFRFVSFRKRDDELVL